MPPLTVETVVDPGYGTVLGEAAEDDDRTVVAQPIEKDVDDLGVPDELERDEGHRALDVVVADPVLVAVDGGDHEIPHRPDGRQCVTQVLRLGEVEGDAAGRAADLGRDLLGTARRGGR